MCVLCTVFITRQSRLAYCAYAVYRLPSASLDEKTSREGVVGLDSERRLATVVPLPLDARDHSRLRE